MFDPIIRKEVFPLPCQYPGCGNMLDEQTFLDAVDRFGLPYVDGGEKVCQGFTCPKCLKTSIFGMIRDNPVVNLQHFVISPIPNGAQCNCYEQWFERCRANDGFDSLKFKSIPAWEETEISSQEIDQYFKSNPSRTSAPYERELPYLCQGIKDEGITTLMNHENQNGTIRFRRLYPDTVFYRSLFLVLLPQRAVNIDNENYLSIKPRDQSRYFSGKVFSDIGKSWNALIELCAGQTIREAVLEKFSSVGFTNFDEGIVDEVIEKHSVGLRRNSFKLAGHVDDLNENIFTVGAIEKFRQFDGWTEIVSELIPPICTEIALDGDRHELTRWKDRVKPGEALFVDAPLGIGKTMSIAKVLANDPNISAVIFMPTNQLCEEFINTLKQQLIKSVEHNANDDITNPTDDVYFADGIRMGECPSFEAIINRYKQNWIVKRDLCAVCDKNTDCRFLKHQIEVPRKRIVITTHHQYVHFYNNSATHNWKKPGADQPVKRDFFIIDEDMVLSQCYQPIALSEGDFTDFIGTIINFLSEHGDNQDTKDKIYKLAGWISVCQKTALLAPVDRAFQFSDKVRMCWEKSFPDNDRAEYIPDVIEREDVVGNHLDVIEHAIRKGCTVLRYAGSPKKIYLSNPRTYDLANLPPHVFFDGTKLDKDFLEHKLKNIRIETMTISPPSPALWKYQVWQNENSDLPKKYIEQNEPAVKELLESILPKYYGQLTNVLVITKKEIRGKYLDNFIAKRLPMGWINLLPPIHFGNLKGINRAEKCSVVIMLGSYAMSDAVEIALALDFIDNEQLDDNYMTPYPNMWHWDNKGMRKYREKYSKIEELAKAVRHSEQRQALGRTRYIFHDVDFYILSKDRIGSYEPLLKDIEPHAFGNDLFPPRQIRSDTKYDEVKNAIIEHLKSNGTAKDMDIHKSTRINRITIRNHRKAMLGDSIIEYVTKTKYQLADKDKWI